MCNKEVISCSRTDSGAKHHTGRPQAGNPQLADWYRGKLHHMIAMRKILTTHYPTAQSAAVSLPTHTQESPEDSEVSEQGPAYTHTAFT